MDTVEMTAHRAGRKWGWTLLYGVLLIVLGVVAMANPLVTGLAIGIVLSVSFLFGGAGSLVAAFTDAGWQAKAVDILFGVLALLAGFICMMNPFGGAVSLVWVIGVVFLVTGGFELVAGFRAAREKVWLILLGIFDLLIGFWMTFLLGPGAALVALATLVGLSFLFRGVLISVMAFKVRRLNRVDA